MFDRKTLKTRAKFVLKRSLFPMILACIILSFVSNGIFSIDANKLLNIAGNTDPIKQALSLGVIGLMVILGIASSIFIAAPLTVGLKYFMLRAADGDAKIEDLLFPFKNGYKNILLTLFVKNLYIFLWTLVCTVPLGVIIWKFGIFEKVYALYPQISAGDVSAAISISGTMSLLMIIAAILSVPALIKTLQYSQVEYLLAENPKMRCRDAISKSKELMVGNKWAYVKLDLSFLGWMIIANMYCGIGMLILNPYIEQTFTQLYLEITGQGKDYEAFTYQQNGPFGY